MFKPSGWSSLPIKPGQEILLTPILLHRRLSQHILHRQLTKTPESNPIMQGPKISKNTTNKNRIEKFQFKQL